MDNLNIEIGNRLRDIRYIFNEGSKLSAKQFAYLMNETTDRILNYENGRAAISLQLIVNLYRRGINPTYLLIGDGDRFADNDEGRLFKKKIAGLENSKVELLTAPVVDELSLTQMLDMAVKYQVAAGDIIQVLRKKTENT